MIKNTPQLGSGMYTVPDIAHILRVPAVKVNRWVKEYWDKKFAVSFGNSYSWKSGSSRAVDFQTLIELCICFKFSEEGISTKAIIEAHQALSRQFNNPHPFASEQILPRITADEKKIYFKEGDDLIYSLDPHRQFNVVQFIQLFFKNIEFNEDSIAQRLWPLGKGKHIVVDPGHQFGQPVIENTNIYPETLYGLYKAGEHIHFIAHIYEISEQDVNDAIEFCMAA